ncbi:SHOCT domain-containing protein [Hyphobacterium sp.]|uniref:SHOCT domain-containing protein n=1 Tax=Hyphobacterium sp. TaxID=2004662 RepID=UPI00374A6BA9
MFHRVSFTVTGLVLAMFAVSPAQAQTELQTEVAPTLAAEERSDADLWSELQSLSGSQAEDSLWDAAEMATEQVFGSAIERDTGEAVFQTLEAAADGDWRHAGQTAGPALLSVYLPGVGQYIELIQSAAQQIDRATDTWSRQLYEHESYRWVAEEVQAEYQRLRMPLIDVIGDPFYGYVNDDTYAFVPSYALPVGSEAQTRARAFEAQLFHRWNSQPFMDALIATDYTANSGGVSGLYTQSFAAMIREELGYEPEPRRLFNYFYHQATRRNLETYVELHEFVEAEHMRRFARQRRQDVIDAYRAALAELNRPQPYLTMACRTAAAFQPGFDGELQDDEANRRVRELREELRQITAAEGFDLVSFEQSFRSELPGGLLTDISTQFSTADLEERAVNRTHSASVDVLIPPDVLAMVWSGSPQSFGGSWRTAHVALGKALADLSAGILDDHFGTVNLISRYDEAQSPLILHLTGMDFQYRNRAGLRTRWSGTGRLGVSACFEGEFLFEDSFLSEETEPYSRGSNFANGDSISVVASDVIRQLLDMASMRVPSNPAPRLATYLAGEAPRERLTGEAAEAAAALNPRQDSSPASPAVAQDSQDSTVDRLRQVYELRDAGLISESEFEELRTEVLRSLTETE